MVEREKRQKAGGSYLQLSKHDVKNNKTKYPIENISRGGLRFFSTDEFEIDDRYELNIYLENGNTHSAMGRICYCENNTSDKEGHYYGISFLNNYLEASA
ncbi:MAG: PilZ domain-containing protein [Gammaproteobacteria bacterium]|nr:PilZ domain-containing protein [Gammaproteobacteria bacterium]